MQHRFGGTAGAAQGSARAQRSPEEPTDRLERASPGSWWRSTVGPAPGSQASGPVELSPIIVEYNYMGPWFGQVRASL